MEEKENLCLHYAYKQKKKSKNRHNGHKSRMNVYSYYFCQLDIKNFMPHEVKAAKTKQHHQQYLSASKRRLPPRHGRGVGCTDNREVVFIRP